LSARVVDLEVAQRCPEDWCLDAEPISAADEIPEDVLGLRLTVVFNVEQHRRGASGADLPKKAAVEIDDFRPVSDVLRRS
jgi:hypothetical protein